MEQTKLDRLLIAEISGVDEPANQIPGWMVTKAAGDAPDPFLLLADEMEAVTKASDSKQPYGDVTYADPGYQKDGKKRYPLDTDAHVRAAWSYINKADNASAYSAEQLATIKSKIKAAMKKIGAEVEGGDATQKSDSESIVAKIKGIVLGTPGKDIDMEKDELVTILAERDEALVKSLGEAVAEAVAKSVAPAEGAAEGDKTEGAAAPEATPALTLEEVAKAVSEAIEEQVVKVYNEIFENALNRIEGIEKKFGIVAKSSLDGQEGGKTDEPVAKSTPKLSDAIASALKPTLG